MMRRLMLVPLMALALLVSGVGVASADPASGPWEEVSGEAYFVLDDSAVIQPITPIGNSGKYRDQIHLPLEGYLDLPEGTVSMRSGATIRRVFNQTFLDYLVALDSGDFPGMLANGDWDGMAVGPSTVVLNDDVTCEGQLVVRFGEGFQAPGMSRLRCDDGSHLFLRYNGGAELLGAGYDDIAGAIR